MRRHKPDAIQEKIVEELKAFGCRVKVVSDTTSSFVDLIVSHYPYIYLVEIKKKGGKLTDGEQEFHSYWDCMIIIADNSAEIWNRMIEFERYELRR